MVAFNFKQQFAGAVERGEKRQTIRQTARCKPGDVLQLYTGQRTPKCRLIAVAKCISVVPITIWSDGITVDNRPLSDPDEIDFVRADGFDGRSEMYQFFEDQYGLPFEGWLIEWEPQS